MCFFKHLTLTLSVVLPAKIDATEVTHGFDVPRVQNCLHEFIVDLPFRITTCSFLLAIVFRT